MKPDLTKAREFMAEATAELKENNDDCAILLIYNAVKAIIEAIDPQ